MDFKGKPEKVQTCAKTDNIARPIDNELRRKSLLKTMKLCESYYLYTRVSDSYFIHSFTNLNAI